MFNINVEKHDAVAADPAKMRLFWRRVAVIDTGCWIWTGPLNDSGYGRFGWTAGGKTFCANAHRVAYTATVASVPAALTVDHLCHGADTSCAGGPTCPHRACVRPDHLEPVPMRTNTMRGSTITAANAAKTHCSNGHTLEGAKWNGHQRICTPCATAATLRSRAKRRSK